MLILAETDAMTVLTNQYGPIAFGLVALLVLWKLIVKPAMDDRKVDTEGMGKIADAMTTAAAAMTSAATEAKQAAQINQVTAQTLNTLTMKVLGLVEGPSEQA